MMKIGMAQSSRVIGFPPPESAGALRGGPVDHPQFAGGRARMTISGLPPGDEAATAVTIAHMAQYAKEDSLSPIIRRAAAEATQDASSRNTQELCAGVFRWIQRRVRFQNDEQTAAPIWAQPSSTEVLIRPLDLLTMPQPAGDCDDFSMLCASMLRALGIETSFKTVAADPAAPATYTHVYVIAHTPAGDVAVDTSHGTHPGWEVESAGKTRTWKVEDAMNQLGALPSWATDLIKIGGQTGAQIAQARYGQPPQGTYIQQGGNVLYRQPDNATALAFPGVGVNLGTGTGSGWLLLILGLGALLLIGKR